MLFRSRHTAIFAAVLVPVFRDAEGRLRLVLLRRTEGGAHGGQIALPGGMCEPSDRSACDTALREAEEEIGLPPESVEVLAELPALETRTTGYRITPFLARVTPPPAWRPDPEEVAEILEVGIDDLLRPEARGETIEHFPTWPAPLAVRYVRIGPHRLWGATFRILEPLLPRIAAGEWRI